MKVLRANQEWPSQGVGRTANRFSEPEFWIVQAGVVTVTLGHLGVELLQRSEVVSSSFAGLYHLPVIAYLIPVVYAGIQYGLTGGILTGLLVTILTIPNTVMFHQHGAEWLGELISVLAVLGIGIVVSALVEREERVRRESVAAEGRLELLDIISTGLTRLSNANELLDWVLNSLANSIWLDAAGFSPAREIRWLSPIVRGQADSETERMKTISADIDGEWASGSEVHPTSVPVASDRVRFGTLRVMPTPDSTLDPRDVELLAIVGQALGIALDNARLQETERENLQIYAREVTRAQEEERKRIARNLHDAAAQSLIILSRGLDALTQVQAIPNEAAEQLEKLRTMALEALEGVRNAGSELRPSILDDLGIAAAIEWLVRQIADRSDFKTDCIISGRRRRLATDTELAVFRIAQEALHNANRHSEATHVQVALTFQETLLSLEVQDNGKGFDLEHVTSTAAIGLTNMRERADLVQGWLTIASVPGRGTTVTLLVEA